MKAQITMAMPARYAALDIAEQYEVFGGDTVATTSGTGIIKTTLSDLEKWGKVFNYLARIFSAASSLINNITTIYTSITALNDYISKNF